MNKNAIQKYAIWARNELIEQVKQRAYQYGINEEGYGDENAAVIAGRVLSTEERKQRREFVEQIQKNGYQQAVEEVAYTWFNRFIALRFMEVNDYLPTHVRVFSDASGGFNPEILKDVLHLELDGLDKSKVSELLNANQTEELYRYLLLTQCNALNAALPEMFEKLGGYTEMLLPNNILKPDGVLGRLVSDIIPEDTWRDGVQIIGWMYQYYNTEPKQAVFDGLKKNIKITKEKIPAATQLFTPDWIVRYMVENSLGRLWLESHPDLTLKSNWKYYLDEAEQTPEVAEKLRVLRSQAPVKSPEYIRLIDPCMGSGHILVYAFDVMMQIYEREGYNPRDAARLILKKNIYGLEIDKRAYQLAYFALMMKARQYNRRILTFDIKPNVFYFIDSNRILGAHLDLMGADLMPVELYVCKENIPHLLNDFNDATEYGSLVKIEREYPYELLRKFAKSQKTGQMTISDNPQNYYNIKASEMDLLQIIDLAETLSRKYDVVVTNPPYMGSRKGMNPKLKKYVEKEYKEYKSDLYTCFIKKCLDLCVQKSYVAMITQQSFMFTDDYKELRAGFLSTYTFINMLHLGADAFEEISGEVVQTTTFIVGKQCPGQYTGTYVRLVDYPCNEKPENIFNKQLQFNTSSGVFDNIKASPISYWLSDMMRHSFDIGVPFEEYGMPRQGMATGDNDRFLRNWHEVNYDKINIGSSSVDEFHKSKKLYIPYNKGGLQIKWYGNNDYVIMFDEYNYKVIASQGNHLPSRQYYCQECITWSDISGRNFAARYCNKGFVFDVKGSCGFPQKKNLWLALAFLNSKLTPKYIDSLNPTTTTQVGDLKRIPIIPPSDNQKEEIDSLSQRSVELAKYDWDSYETSWDFIKHPLITSSKRLSDAYNSWNDYCKIKFTELKQSEERINQIFIALYGLKDEINEIISEKEINLRVADKATDIKGLISYAVGCMFGRYSLDVEGLVYAGGDWDSGKYRSFIPDKDNILPICDDEYFDDDILGRFVDFIRVVYGAETLEENLRFIADALGGKGTPREVIREYFLNGFYKDHCKIYQKRPIYWLFDSGKKNGFKALIYLHRYSRDLLAKLRTDYVHEQQERYRTQISHIATALDTATGADRARLLKQQDKLTEQLKEITAFEEKVHHLADQHIEIDLDDGVKKNYEIFTDVLAKI